MRRILTVAVMLCVVTAGVPGTAIAAEGGTATEEPTRAAPAGAAAATASNHTATVTVLAYNDIQTAAAEDGTFPRLVQLIHERRTALGADNAVVVGAGDDVSPHALSPVSEWRVATAVLNEVDPAADAVGNHEFDFGYDPVSDIQNDSEFPWLATNLVENGTDDPFQNTNSYEIVERNGVRVGIIGLIDEGATYGKTNIDFAAEGLTVRNETEAGPAAAEMLKQEENVDVVVALAHTGVPDAQAVAEADDGAIDAIFVGDDERYYPPQETSGTVIAEAEARAAYLGEVNLTVDTGANDVTAWNGRLINVTASGVAKNETASEIITGYRANVSLDSTVTTSEVPLDARSSTNYHEESAYGNLITDAMRERTGADVAITNAGGIRSNTVYGPGPITGGDVFNTLPFGNTLVTVELTGAELRETLESQVVTIDSETGQQFGSEISQQTSGVRFTWNEDTGEVADMTVDGEPVDPEATYEVTVNSYIAAGGSGYPLEDAPRVSTEDTIIAEVVVDYLGARDTIAPEVEGRMVRVTTELADRTAWSSGNGVVALRYDRPADVTSVDGSSFYALGPDGERVEARKAFARGNSVVVQFDSGELNELGDSGTEVDVLGGYADRRYEDSRVYWNDAVLHGDVTLLTPEQSGGNGNNGSDD
jgi:2',3'-cyclic-nucleotide 2'-phosphodiesterase (5'-nucleotidase family)